MAKDFSKKTEQKYSIEEEIKAEVKRIDSSNKLLLVMVIILVFANIKPILSLFEKTILGIWQALIGTWYSLSENWQIALFNVFLLAVGFLIGRHLEKKQKKDE